MTANTRASVMSRLRSCCWTIRRRACTKRGSSACGCPTDSRAGGGEPSACGHDNRNPTAAAPTAISTTPLAPSLGAKWRLGSWQGRNSMVNTPGEQNHQGTVPYLVAAEHTIRGRPQKWTIPLLRRSAIEVVLVAFPAARASTAPNWNHFAGYQGAVLHVVRDLAQAKGPRGWIDRDCPSR
jgi:hypothetical protein